MKISLVLIILFAISFTFAQDGTQVDSKPFQTFFRDAQVSPMPYGEAGLTFENYAYGSGLNIGAQGAYPINSQIEVGAGFGFKNYNPDVGDGQSGITDVRLSGLYNLSNDPAIISAGGYVTLPVGEEKVGAGKLNFGAFGSTRYPLANGMIVVGTVGLDFMESKKVEMTFNQTTFDYDIKEKTEYKTSVLLGAGAIYPVNPKINVIGELNIWTEGDYMFLTGGGDYALAEGSKLRGAIGLGLDDGAPDLSILFSFFKVFN